ncbi:hypothetical protein, partial [Enterobacter roggenkampii]|uniref:hypothetical protein n=1 Tax=Enterobacter roggenkampii TaxID=1812935 RepID=UPI001C1E1870
PTHGLLSRRSTDRISTSPLANFAQLSMFRFDGLIKNHSCFIVNNNSCIYGCIGFIWLYLKGIYFLEMFDGGVWIIKNPAGARFLWWIGIYRF